jgi:hypothetical protein
MSDILENTYFQYQGGFFYAQQENQKQIYRGGADNRIADIRHAGALGFCLTR